MRGEHSVLLSANDNDSFSPDSDHSSLLNWLLGRGPFLTDQMIICVSNMFHCFLPNQAGKRSSH